ncbi:hypothetical protein KY289_001811 [Solanum tuberosum]|nr:hypothetical protein KY289_001811 [Solanum tuberosum]
MALSKAEFLPEELIIDILYRLPVNSIGRCRCLSKHWRNFLSDPQFIKLHFNPYTRRETHHRHLATRTLHYHVYPPKWRNPWHFKKVRKGLWEKLENSPYDHSPFEPRSGVLVNGALHWLARTASENSTTIAAFDSSVDKFSEEYGVKESWTKFKITVHVPLTTLLCSIGDDDVLLVLMKN